MITTDYIFAGAGAAGLMMAWRMLQFPDFADRQFLLIDKDNKSSNDRSWCYWEIGEGEWDIIVHKSWQQAIIKSEHYSNRFSIAPYTYKMIRASDFYAFIKEKLAGYDNVSWRLEKVLSYKDYGDKVLVLTDKESYQATSVFSSLFDKSHIENQKKYPYLKQHFVGWFVKTAAPCFDPDAVTFMDFSIPQKGNTRFMYCLPFNKHAALVEYTLFSSELLSKQEYENAISDYLKQMGVTDFEVTEKEHGSIPMSCYDFSRHNTKNILHIGTAGGWTKPSSGFTFHNISRLTKELPDKIKHSKDFSKLAKRSRFWYYDLLLLDVLDKHNESGAALFTALFQHNQPQQIFRFLDEQTKLTEEPAILLSLPFRPFLRALLGRLSL